jgi:Flp pilus assembly protein TadD
MVAALFGWHPLHVESVAWISERKDVLSGLFGLLALSTYARYSEERRTVERSPAPAWQSASYQLTLVFLALGLLSKPMLVTWPFLMLLLDYWPLRRLEGLDRRVANWRGLVMEKIPFFGLAAISSVVTFLVQRQEASMATFQNVSLGARTGNALISYCRYLGKLLWPADLAVIYPYPPSVPLVNSLLAAALLLIVSRVLIKKQRQHPFLLMGWLWYLGTLVPVLGLVQVGDASMADRYMYLPSIGALVTVVWGGYELTRTLRHQATVLSVAGLAVIAACLGLTRLQLRHWKDGESLFRHALAVTKDNCIAHINLGSAFLQLGRVDEAVDQFREAVRLKPNLPTARNDLAIALLLRGQADEAVTLLRESMLLEPDNAQAVCNLGNALLIQGKTDEAISQFREALRLQPNFPEAHNNWGSALLKDGRIDEAISKFRQALQLQPDFAEAHNNLGNALLKQGRIDEAISKFREALRFNPGYDKARDNLDRASAMKTGGSL